MRDENRVKLESCRHVLENRGGSQNQVMKIFEVIRDEWDPNYKCDFWCSACVMNMVEYAFNKLSNENSNS